MTDFQIIEAKPYHAGRMARLLRAEHHHSIIALGFDPHRELRARFHESSFRRAWLIDGQLAALGGLVGTTLSPYAIVWLALSSLATKYPVATVKEARRQLDEIMQTHCELATTLMAGDSAAYRFACFLGFHCGENGTRAYTRAGRRDLVHHLDRDVDLRIPVGKSYLVRLGYRADEAA